ncbi:MAG: DUF1109 domain-containing protein [Methylocystaceae bacterium]|nr:MAG: DUF1109 domain-containing protein [Methylocystaceae bacterium]
MKTDELIDILSTNLERVDDWRASRTLFFATSAGAAFAVVAAVLGPGLREDWNSWEAFAFLGFKLTFAMSVVGLGYTCLNKLVRPGGERAAPLLIASLPFIAIVLLGFLSLALTPSSHWAEMMVGDQWLECLLSIPIIAIVPFAVVILVVRRGAPTDLTRAGAMAGFVSGGLSTIGYAFHCMDDSFSFVALWYAGTIALCTLAGATLGPRLLHW